jgi:hypothetical protein
VSFFTITQSLDTPTQEFYPAKQHARRALNVWPVWSAVFLGSLVGFGGLRYHRLIVDRMGLLKGDSPIYSNEPEDNGWLWNLGKWTNISAMELLDLSGSNHENCQRRCSLLESTRNRTEKVVGNLAGYGAVNRGDGGKISFWSGLKRRKLWICHRYQRGQSILLGFIYKRVGGCDYHSSQSLPGYWLWTVETKITLLEIPIWKGTGEMDKTKRRNRHVIWTGCGQEVYQIQLDQFLVSEWENMAL